MNQLTQISQIYSENLYWAIDWEDLKNKNVYLTIEAPHRCSTWGEDEDWFWVSIDGEVRNPDYQDPFPIDYNKEINLNKQVDVEDFKKWCETTAQEINSLDGRSAYQKDRQAYNSYQDAKFEESRMAMME